jgi:hypothetical protein
VVLRTTGAGAGCPLGDALWAVAMQRPYQAVGTAIRMPLGKRGDHAAPRPSSLTADG